VPVRLRPLTEASEMTIAGKLPSDATVGYCQVQDVRAGDVVCVIVAQTALVEEAEAGSSSLVVESTEGMGAGTTVALTGSGGGELVTVAGVSGGNVALRAPLEGSYGIGEKAAAVRCYEVGGVIDEGGAGHHQKLILGKVQIR